MSRTDAETRIMCSDLSAVVTVSDDASTALASALAELGTFAGCAFGLWEAGPGTDVDVEDDELFLVLSGRGQIQFEDGSTIQLGPGMLVHLREGDRTTWTITERLRKFYLSSGDC